MNLFKMSSVFFETLLCFRRKVIDQGSVSGLCLQEGNKMDGSAAYESEGYHRFVHFSLQSSRSFFFGVGEEGDQ